jgi:cell division septation protein DedD
MFALAFALIVLVSAIWTATRLARSPAAESTGAAPVQPPPSEPSPEVGAGQTPLAPPQLDSLPYSLQVAALNTLDRAAEYAVALENRRLVAAVTPIRIGGSIWYRVILGALPTAADAEAALVGLWRDGLVERGEGAILRTPQAFDLGVRESDAAWEETQMLRERGIPAYSVEASLGTARIFVGAFETPDQAAVVESLLMAAGLTATLMTRTGSAR